VHSLYRCRCLVGYRPFSTGDQEIIWFPERQIAGVTLSMNWSPDALTANAETSVRGATQFVNALSGSTVNVTLSDPYMTGASWAVLFDTAAAYTGEQLAAANHILLPKCEKEQVSTRENPCRPYEQTSSFEDPGVKKASFSQFAHLVVIFYYNVGNNIFSLESYFRVNRFNINHGKTYPKVTISGLDPQTIAFNQNLDNFQMKENETLEENLKEIAKQYGYRVSFCNSPEANYGQKYIMPSGFREKAVTGEEVLKKYIESVGGNYNKLPLKEYANKISICTRANVNQGCSIFYLGKGLYEYYSISGSVERDFLNSNAELEFKRGLGIDYDTTPIDGEEYTLEDTFPDKRKAKIASAKTGVKRFPEQFAVLKKRFIESQATSGYVWSGNGPVVRNTKVDNINLYGIGVNDNVPISFLDGLVENRTFTPDVNGSLWINIQTNYVLKVCDKEKKCTIRPIHQEVGNLLTIQGDLKRGSKVNINQVLGEANSGKLLHTRFYIPKSSAGTTTVTLEPSLVWNFAIPTLDLNDEEKKQSGAKSLEPVAVSENQRVFAGRTGNTGFSEGPHLHIELFESTASSGRGGPLTSADIDPYIRVGGKRPSEWSVTSSYNAPRESGPHKGIDYGTPTGTVIEVIGGAKILRKIPNFGNYGNTVEILRPDGKVLLLAHLEDGSLEDVSVGARGGTNSSGSRYGQGVQNSPTPVGVTVDTEFKGIPRALRIVPGRTILAFVTQYDKWIEGGRPSNIDPGVWIPQRFSKWFVKSAEYRWDGDLRVKVTGVSDWGVSVNNVPAPPTFEDYLATENFKYRDYYGYIRSLGDLCWNLGNGKTSCEEFCKEAEEVREFLQRSRDVEQSRPSSVTSEFPEANCKYVGSKYPADRVNAIINAARQGGINTKAGYAGVVGNAIIESRKDIELNPAAENPSGAFGIFQWLGSRRMNLESYSAKLGKSPSDFNVQMGFFVQELKTTESRTVAAVNKTSTPKEAAYQFGIVYERAVINNVPGTLQKREEREQAAQDIFDKLECQ
jgi:hypothetical protein